MITARQNLYR
jgi:hypothetical protein